MLLRANEGYLGRKSHPKSHPIFYPKRKYELTKCFIMTYRPYVDLTKVRKDGLSPVVLVFEDCGKRFKVSTGLFAKNQVVGREFPGKEPNARAKTAVLGRKMVAVDDYLLTRNANTPTRQMMDEIRAIVSGKERKQKKTLAGFVSDFATTKDKPGTRGLYEATVKKILSYDANATFDTVDSNWLNGWRKANAHMSDNGFSIHLRNLRTVFNWAIDNEYTDKYPFRRYKVKNERVAIRNISVDELRALRDYPVEPWQEIYRDLFMLTFYLCGINPVDLLHLKPSDMKNGRIRYKRRKTGRLYDIPVPTPAKGIISRYAGKKWLLRPLDEYSDYKDFCHHWNDALKKIGKSEKVADKTGKRRKIKYTPIVEGLTVYVARYTFASIGAEIDIPRETIALCLGHAWTDVTSRYIAYDFRKIDEAVKKIVTFVGKK